jgi:L-ascorbate metabolism protein UlaG (beta-lactamase superfamily)
MDSSQPALLQHLHWYGHDSFRLDRPMVIYLDPWRLPPGAPAADLILVTHHHHDHCSPEDVAAIRRPTTRLVANASAAAKLTPPVSIVAPGDRLKVEEVEIEAVPAYNLDKSFHPKEEAHVGFVLELLGERLYFAGDTDVIPEMSEIRCDVALLPVSGVYVMTADEAVEAARRIRPRLAIPMHYGAGVAGGPEDAATFARSAPVPVVVLQSDAA